MADVVMNLIIGRSSNWLGNMPDKHAIRDHSPASQQYKLFILESVTISHV